MRVWKLIHLSFVVTDAAGQGVAISILFLLLPRYLNMFPFVLSRVSFCRNNYTLLKIKGSFPLCVCTILFPTVLFLLYFISIVSVFIKQIIYYAFFKPNVKNIATT